MSNYTVRTRQLVQSVRTGNDLSAYVFPTSEPQDVAPTARGSIQWDDAGDAWTYVGATWQRRHAAHVFLAGQDNYPSPSPSGGGKLVLQKISGFTTTQSYDAAGRLLSDLTVTTPSTAGLYVITAMVSWPASLAAGDISVTLSGDSKTWVTKGRKTGSTYGRTLCVNALTSAVSTTFTLSFTPDKVDYKTFDIKVRLGAAYLGPLA